MQNPRHEGRIRRKHVDECHYDGEKRRAHVLNVSYLSAEFHPWVSARANVCPIRTNHDLPHGGTGALELRRQAVGIDLTLGCDQRWSVLGSEISGAPPIEPFWFRRPDDPLGRP